MFASCLSCRRGLVVGSSSCSSSCRRGLVVVSSSCSSSCRRRVVVDSLPSGKALGGVFCVFLLLRPKTLIALSRLREVAPNRVLLSVSTSILCGRRNRFASSRSFMLRVFLRIALSALRKVVPRCKFRRRRGIL